VADYFISYTSSDRDWAFWIARELKTLGHTAHIHEWEIEAGQDIYAWMEQRHDAADHVLCVVSPGYLKAEASYSKLERNAALFQAADKRPGFALIVVVEPTRLPTMMQLLRRCELDGLSQEAARDRLVEFIARREEPIAVDFPDRGFTHSNIPFRVPEHFLGREESLTEIHKALTRSQGRVAVTALHGLRGVGKTTLAVAYADRYRDCYRATWWINAQTEATMRADMVALGVRLEWVSAEVEEEVTVANVMRRLGNEDGEILLIYDNAIDAASLRPYLPRGGSVRVLITSNAPTWRGIAEPVEIQRWPEEIGAHYFVARTGRKGERDGALALSKLLDGLPLAHEQAAAYCERLECSFDDYMNRFEATPAKLLDDDRHAAADYHEGRTVAKTFTLAIEEAARLHPAAEPLIALAALLAPEPIPLFLFEEGREQLGEPLASDLAEDGLLEAIAALRAFALVERETVVDEREPAIKTSSIRLHRLVREIAALRCSPADRTRRMQVLVVALAAIYPSDVFNHPATWSRARRLDALAMALVDPDGASSVGIERAFSELLDQLATYRVRALADYAAARPLYERALAIGEPTFGPDHVDTAAILNNLAYLHQAQWNLVAARQLHERALAIREKALEPDHIILATSLTNLAKLHQSRGDLTAARSLFERALSISEKSLGPEHPDMATTVNNLAFLHQEQGNLAAARPLHERALTISENGRGREHPDTATCLDALGRLHGKEGNIATARRLIERALAIRGKAFGPEHPDTADSLNNLASLLANQQDFESALPLFERALEIREKVLGPNHRDTAHSLNSIAFLHQRQGDFAAARPLFYRALDILENVVGPDHSDTANCLTNLASLLKSQGDIPTAKSLYERALAIREKVLGPNHHGTTISLSNLAYLHLEQRNFAAAQVLYERALAICELALEPDHPETSTCLTNLASVYERQGIFPTARTLNERALRISEKARGFDHPTTMIIAAKSDRMR